LVLTIELNEVRWILITYHSNAIGGSSGGDGDYEEDVLRACVRCPIGVDSRNAELQGKNMLVTSVNIKKKYEEYCVLVRDAVDIRRKALTFRKTRAVPTFRT